MLEAKLDKLNLSAKERQILEELFKLTKKKGAKKNTVCKTDKLQPSYVNRYETRCDTCKAVFFESYYMEQSPEHGGLIGMLIPEDKVTTVCDVRTSVKDVVICKYCKERLMKIPKEEIINRLLKERFKWI